MTDIELLKQEIDDSGLSMVTIAKRSGIPRVTLYNRMRGVGEFTGDEILGLTTALRLTKTQRDKIFLSKKLN